MAQKTRAELKSFFQTGDIPNESNYVDLIDSFFSITGGNSGSLVLTGSIFLTGSNGNLTASNVSVSDNLITNNLQATTIGATTFTGSIDFDLQNMANVAIGSGNINNTVIGNSTPNAGTFTTLASINGTSFGNSVDDRHFFIGGVTGSSFLVQDVNGNGDLYAHEIIVGDRSSNSNALTISTSGSLFASSSITSSANISASGTLYGSEAYITGHITASGNISASGTIFADNFQSTGGDVGGISFADEVNITGNITASGNISSSGTVFANALDLEGANIKYIASQNILKFGDAIKLGIGAGVTEAVGDLTISSDGANAILNANVGNVTLNTSAGDTIIKNSSANGNILLQSDKSGGGQQGGVVLISGSNTHISLDVRGNITASNISASGTLFANTLNASELTGITHITASGNISASGTVLGENLNINGPSNSHIEVGTYNVGFDTANIDSLQITGSGLIVSGAMADNNHHNFIKIGETEIVDVKNGARSALLIHNVDEFVVATGSDGGNLFGEGQKLIEHTGDDFRVFSAGTTIFNFLKSNNSLAFGVSNGTTALNGNSTINGTFSTIANNTTETYSSSRHIAVFDTNPNTAPQKINSLPVDTFFSTITGAVTASAVSASGTGSFGYMNLPNLPTSDPGVAGALFTTQSTGTGGNLDGQLVLLVSQG